MHPGYGAEFHYSIVRERGFQEKFELLVQDHQRLSELESAMDWALARRPHRFTQIMTDSYLLVTEDLGEFGIPSLRILYTVDNLERKVLLIDVELKP
jgi:hypothetical protein